MEKLQAFLRRDGWLLALLCACVAACALLGGSDADTSPEGRVSKVLSEMTGAGRVEVAIFYEEDAQRQSVPCGAVVVADGAGDVGVRLRLRRAVQTLLGLGEECVEVFERGGG